jgi:hypothetical protein
MAAAVRRDITPRDLRGLHPVGGGSFASVHDRIFMRTLLLRAAEAELTIISLELIEVGDMVPLRARIEYELGIPSDHVLVCATHTHSAPRLGEVSPGASAHGLTPEGALYTAWVYDQVIDSLREARAELRPARIGAARGRIDLNVNRDAYVNGSYELGVNPGGPSDKSLPVINVVAGDGRPIAVLMTYAIHPVVTLGTRQVSGDLAGAASRHAEAAIGEGVVALWTAGPLGDQEPRLLAPRPPLHEPPPPDYNPSLAFALAEAQGTLLASEAVRVRGTIRRYEHSPRIAVRETVTELPVKLRTDDPMPSMKQEQVPSLELRTVVAVIGTLALAGVGGELVTKLGELIRARSPLTHTTVLSLVNDRLGYLVDDSAYASDTFEVRGSPIPEGHAEDAIVGGITDSIRAMLA